MEDEIAEIMEIVSTEPWEVVMRLKCSVGLLVSMFALMSFAVFIGLCAFCGC